MTQIIDTTPEEPAAAALPDSFKRKAEKLDKKIRAIVNRIETDYVALGEQFLEMKTKAYHTTLGFPRFEEYLANVIPQKSKSQIFQAMRIVRELTEGEKPAVSKDEVRSMTRENAEGLAKIKSKGTTVTPTMISAAQSMTHKQFEKEVLNPVIKPATALDGSPAADVPDAVVLVKKTLTVTKETADELEICYEIGRHICADDDRTISLDDKILQSMCAEFRNTYESEYNAWKAADAAESLHTAMKVAAQDGPDSVAEVLEAAERIVELDEDAMAAGDVE